MQPTSFILIGAGWRAEFFLRIAAQLPDRFHVAGVLCRRQERAELLTRMFGVRCDHNLDSLVKECMPDFAVVSVPASESPKMIEWCVRASLPVLGETPPAASESAMDDLNRAIGQDPPVQIAEQYAFQPMHAARMAVIESGLIGEVVQAQVSCAHGYHGVSLLLSYLGHAGEPVSVNCRRFRQSMQKAPSRNGPPETVEMIEATQDIAFLTYGSKVGVYDFMSQQYFSPIRQARVLIRGTHGEINGSRVVYSSDAKTSSSFLLERQNAGEDGNLEGYHLKSIQGGCECWYQNPFAPARLSDDEIAVATCLSKMSDYVKNGPAFYPLKTACRDQSISLLIDRAAKTGQTEQSE